MKIAGRCGFWRASSYAWNALWNYLTCDTSQTPDKMLLLASTPNMFWDNLQIKWYKNTYTYLHGEKFSTSWHCCTPLIKALNGSHFTHDKCHTDGDYRTCTHRVCMEFIKFVYIDMRFKNQEFAKFLICMQLTKFFRIKLT